MERGFLGRMKKRVYVGKIENGKLELPAYKRKQMASDIAKMKDGKLVELEIRYAGRRSLQNNAYYWCTIVPIMMEALNNLGNDFDTDETHEFLKVNFNSRQVVSKEGELLGTIPGSTAEMNTEEFMIYREDIKRWAADKLSVYIPDPNEQAQINF